VDYDFGMSAHDLTSTARALAAPGKGILAADESLPTIGKRFETIQVNSTEESRRDYREMLFSTAGLGDFISGAILFDETIRQQSRDGTRLVELLEKQNIIPGIKVDKGAKPLALYPGEKITEGLDGLRARFKEYRELGARFSKWRAVITIGEATPSLFGLQANADALARYAALSQEQELVPIVEPEVLMDGNHSIERCRQVTELTLRLVFDALFEHRVTFEQMLLKPNMVLAGSESQEQADVNVVAETTVATMLRTVPAAVPGIVFLSGGQSDELATQHLNAMNQLGAVPWELSFSYGRALQSSALSTWKGQSENLESGQKALLHRARCNHLARLGQYSVEAEKQAA
jgi:fructose-bisphosphate aldolase, class I